MSDHLEIEDTYDVDDSFTVPRLDAAAPAGGRVQPVTAELRSTYSDTDDGRLLRARVTLRRREGDDDTGWQLKVPAEGGRTEIGRPLGDDDRVPAAFAALVAGLTAGRPLVPVAVVSTVRTRHRVLDAAGALVVEVDDDRVRAEPVGAAPVTWREVEVELGTGGTGLLAVIGAELRAAGARPAPGASKLRRALGVPAAPELRAGAAAVRAYLAEQVDAIVAGDVASRRGHDAVHPTRVAVRRFRSTLRVYADTLDAASSAALDAELRWWAGELGAARDAQVQRERHLAAIATLPPELVLGPVVARVTQETRGAEVRAREQVAVVMAGERYAALLATLLDWRDAPPWSGEPFGRGVVRRDAARAAKRADARLRKAVRGGDDEQVHAARKAAKRARYAHELLLAGGTEADRKPAGKAVKRYKRVQQVLGDHQDAVVAAELLRRLGAAAGARGENGFTFGLLWQAEQQAAERARARVREFE